MMLQLPDLLLAFLSTACFIYFLKPRAQHIGLVDRPNARKQHVGAVPLIGGIAIFCGLTFSCLVLDVALHGMRAFFAGALILVIVGVLDDFHELSTRIRFAAQIAASLLMTSAGGLVLEDLGRLSFDGSLFELGAMALPFTVFAAVGVMNAINMSDGVDGLSGSLAAVALVSLAVVAAQAGAQQDLQILTLVLICVLAFLAFNYRLPWRRRATVFMGDAGSLFLGFALAWFVIKFSQGPQRIMTPVAALWFLMVPLFDTVGIMLRRIIRRRSPFAADREHFHHVLQLAGFTPGQTTVILTLIACAGALVGLASLQWQLAELPMYLAFLALFGLYFFGMMRAWKVMRFLRRSICRRTSGQERRQGAVPRRTGERRRDLATAMLRTEPERRTVGADRRQLADRRCSDERRGSAAVVGARSRFKGLRGVRALERTP